MSYDKVLEAKKIVIGTKQTVKALKEGKIREVYIAMDAESKVTAKVADEALQSEIPVRYVDSMKKLGKACGIEVGAAAVGIIR